jgi:competence protein ComEC
MPLAFAAAWALPTALLVPVCAPLAAAVAAAGLLAACRRVPGCGLPGLAALPVLLAGLGSPAAPAPAMPPPGPAWLFGPVAAVVRSPEHGATSLVLGVQHPAVVVHLDRDLSVLPGDAVALLVYVAAPPAPGVPGTVRGFAATASVVPGPPTLGRLAAALRRILEVELLSRTHGEAAGLLAALVLGRDTRPAGELQQAHRGTGLSHLLAVSGAHAAMLAFLLGLTRWNGRPRPGRSGRRTSAVLGLLGAYALITGCEPPVVRAVLAYALAAVAARAGRPCGVVPLLLLPALVTALLQPSALLGPSFLLSYAAVVGLALAGAPHGEPRLARWVLLPLRSSLCAAVLTAPITLWFFGQFAPWTIALTPLLAPLVAVLLLLGLCTGVLGPFLPWAADLVAAVLQALADAYIAVVRAADGLPGTPVHASCAPSAAMLVAAAFVGLVALLAQPTRRCCLGVAALQTLPHWLPLPVRAADELRLFAVGHGQSCLITSASGHLAAIDCGSLQRPYLAAQRLVDALPRRRLDLLVLSHDDQDHHNGTSHLLERVPIDRALLPAALLASPVAAALRARGTAVTGLPPGAVATPAPHLRIWAPPCQAGADDNDGSLWVSAALGDCRVLLCGDAQERGIDAAIAAGFAAPHDVLVLPHHGRSAGRGRELLAAVQPRACLASASTADGETVLGALARRLGSEVWVTGQHGSLALAGSPPRIAAECAARPLPPRQ